MRKTPTQRSWALGGRVGLFVIVVLREHGYGDGQGDARRTARGGAIGILMASHLS